MEELLIILILILLNGVFSMSEIALISARKSNLQADANKGSKAAGTALGLAADPDKFLSSVQIGITLIGILTGIFSGNKVAAALSSLLAGWGMPSSFAGPLAQTIIVVVVTYFSIVLGELVPKRVAMSASEKVAKIVAGPMKIISVIASPFVWLLAKSTWLVVKILGIKSQEAKVTEEEIKSIIQEGTDEGEVTQLEQDLVERVFALGDLKVSTIMTQRNDIIWIDKDMDESEIKEVIHNNLYEIYPVVDGDLDHVIGVLTLKDYVLNIKDGFQLEKMIREPVYFHEYMNVYTVLEEMKAKKISRAIVCDEFGSCSGIITLKDIMEALIGTINDDHQKEPDIVERKEHDGWLVDGQCTLFDFLRHFDIDDSVLQDYDYNTIAGLILDTLDHVPVAGEMLEWNDFSFEIVDMDGARIDKVLVKKIC